MKSHTIARIVIVLALVMGCIGFLMVIVSIK